MTPNNRRQAQAEDVAPPCHGYWIGPTPQPPSIMWDTELKQALKLYGRDSVNTAFGRDSDKRMWGSLDVYMDHYDVGKHDYCYQ